MKRWLLTDRFCLVEVMAITAIAVVGHTQPWWVSTLSLIAAAVATSHLQRTYLR